MMSQTLRSGSDNHGYVIGRDVDSKLQKPKLMELGLGGMTKCVDYYLQWEQLVSGFWGRQARQPPWAEEKQQRWSTRA